MSIEWHPRWLLVGKVPANPGAPKRISGDVISQLIGSASDCGFDKYEEAIQRIIQLPIDLTPMMALAYLYHGSSEFYVEDVFALSESSEHPLNFASMMSLISGSDEASLCYAKISQEGELLASPELFRTKIERVSVPYTEAERMAVARHLQSFELHCRAVHMDSRAVAYAQIAMNPNKVKTLPMIEESEPGIRIDK